MNENYITTKLKAIIDSNMDELDKMTRSFDLITSQILKQSDHQIELLRVLNHQEDLVKEQIKNNTMKHVREIYNTSHIQITGRKAWHE